MKNNLFISAAAGSGKTTYLVNEALKIKDKEVLITTYTENNEAEIKRKIIKINNAIPKNIKVKTWFSFLIKHGVKPFQSYLHDADIKGMDLVSGRSVPKVAEKYTFQHFMNSKNQIYSDKVSKFLVRCNENSKGKVLDRLSRIYHYIFVDEVQDIAGWDFEFLKLLFASKIRTIFVGDPRQGTYSTNDAAKNRQHQKANILNFFKDNSKYVHIDEQILIRNRRSNQLICDLANKLYPHLTASNSANTNKTHHDGIFLVRTTDINTYLSLHLPTQLRYNRNTHIAENHTGMNYGESKGLSFDRVLIYPTTPIQNWLKDNNTDLADRSRAGLYVAITRARSSVAFVYDFQENESIPGTQKFIPN